nr:uncharacterized protein LOC124817399 [Hydra vulgaris]XP_047143354.1 uncharacterized protein LOC124817399 [Hydra vulgaris]XP_047143355.1 uncharacterized protein LOC124817399 [Hydra vulgaris]
METSFTQRNNARETVCFLTEFELFKSYFLSAENVYNESKRMLQVYQLNESSPYKDNGLDFEGVQVLMKDSLRNICIKWAPFLKRYSSLLNLVKMVNHTMATSDSNIIGFQFIVARCRQKVEEFTEKNMIRLQYENGDFAVTFDKFSIPCANLIEVLLVSSSLSVGFNLIHCRKQEAVFEILEIIMHIRKKSNIKIVYNKWRTTMG